MGSLLLRQPPQHTRWFAVEVEAVIADKTGQGHVRFLRHLDRQTRWSTHSRQHRDTRQPAFLDKFNANPAAQENTEPAQG